MKKIETTFCWGDLDELSKQTIFLSIAPFLPPKYPFKIADMMFTWVQCEFVLFLENGTPCIRFSDQTISKVKPLINAYKNCHHDEPRTESSVTI